MKKNKTILSIFLCTALSVAVFTGCKGESTADDLVDESVTLAETVEVNYDELVNFQKPEIDEKIAVMTVKDFGEIKIKLFPEQAEKGVENFIGLAEMGYYDELIFHRVINEFMNQGGDPMGTGMGGKSIWGDKFDGGVSDELFHFSGAIAYANSSGPTTNGSQFYIVNTSAGNANGLDPAVHNENVAAAYLEQGGTPFLDGGYTVFGQVFEGMDVVREIGKVETDSSDKPVDQVQIESVKIVEYQG